jgi:hypothetical protein
MEREGGIERERGIGRGKEERNNLPHAPDDVRKGTNSTEQNCPREVLPHPGFIQKLIKFIFHDFFLDSEIGWLCQFNIFAWYQVTDKIPQIAKSHQ